MRRPFEPISTLVGIKLLHTAIWSFFAASTVAPPVLGLRRRFDWAVVLTVLVLLECVILAFNRCRCPLTDVAACYTEDRADNFDIYLPAWLARHNQTIFGTLFVVGGLVVLGQWLISRR